MKRQPTIAQPTSNGPPPPEASPARGTIAGMSSPKKVLVLCTGNSARSIVGEVLINELGHGELQAFSAGSHPAGTVNPGAIAKLRREGHATDGLESKSWDRFSGAEAPRIDIVITVCDNAASEHCPVWSGSPVTVHWGIPDPASDNDFDSAYRRLRYRIEAMLELPVREMSATELSVALDRVHQSGCRAT